MRSPWERVAGYIERKSARRVYKKPLRIAVQQPFISFTFDDFPRSALHTGGAILNHYGLKGTYYTALGLLGRTDEPSGPVCVLEDLNALLKDGHELASHTYTHCHSWKTDPLTFEKSILKNDEVLNELIPGAEFKSFSYPISEPRPISKKKAGNRFQSCRAGGQTFNVGITDLNQLSSFFLEKSRDRIQDVKELIDKNKNARGWLVFSTHDITENPGPYGCSPEFFEEIVKYSVNSGAQILPVASAVDAIRNF